MIQVGTAAWLLYSRARSVTGTATSIGTWIEYLLPSHDKIVGLLLSSLGEFGWVGWCGDIVFYMCVVLGCVSS